MSNIKNKQQFVDAESSISALFNSSCVTKMSQCKEFMQSRTAEDLRKQQLSVGGFLSGLGVNVAGADTFVERARTIGEWTSKDVDEYIVLVKEKIANDKSLQSKLEGVAQQWRKAVIDEVGRERYDAASKQIGCDLAYAYLDYRLESLMVDKLVKDKMPKSSTDYIMRKAAESSLFGLPNLMRRTAFQSDIAKRGEEAYKPTKGQKLAGKATGVLVDTVALGGGSGWLKLASYASVDVAFLTAMEKMQTDKTKVVTVEDCISQGVFGSKTNVFNEFRGAQAGAKSSKGSNTNYNNNMSNESNGRYSQFTTFQPQQNQFDWSSPLGKGSSDKRQEEKYKDVPLIVAAGKEDEYLEFKKQQEEQEAASSTLATEDNAQQSSAESETEQQSEESEGQADWKNDAGNAWAGLLESTGLNGLTDVGRNLPYVISMLPDILVGLFTGKTDSLAWRNSMMPVAAILAGLFVKNPLLKMLLIGTGGANLLNKAGHEAIGWQKADNGQRPQNQDQDVQFKRYAEQPLNPRIKDPVIKGTSLVATIDNVPCNIQLTQTVVNAYNQGALPLSTLANAVLAKHDLMQQQNMQYGQREQYEQNTAQSQTVHRSR